MLGSSGAELSRAETFDFFSTLSFLADLTFLSFECAMIARLIQFKDRAVILCGSDLKRKLRQGFGG